MPTLSSMSFRKTAACALFLAAVPAFAQSTWYVDDDAGLGGDGQTWPTAFKYLQDALAHAGVEDEIHIACGTYTPDRDELGNVTVGERTESFHLETGVSLYGGYAGLADPENPDIRDLTAYESVLSGDLLGNDGPEFANNDENS